MTTHDETQELLGGVDDGADATEVVEVNDTQVVDTASTDDVLNAAQVEGSVEAAETPESVKTVEPVGAAPAAQDAAEPLDASQWRLAEAAGSAQGGTAQADAPPNAVPDHTPRAAPADSDASAQTPAPAHGVSPGPVWSAATNMGSAPLGEAPPRGTRVGQLIWSGIIIVLGLFLVALAFFNEVDVPILLISLVALLGLGLIIAAVATTRRTTT